MQHSTWPMPRERLNFSSLLSALFLTCRQQACVIRGLQQTTIHPTGEAVGIAFMRLCRGMKLKVDGSFHVLVDGLAEILYGLLIALGGGLDDAVL